MNLTGIRQKRADYFAVLAYGNLILTCASVLTLAATYFISNSELPFQIRTLVFASLVAVYLAFCAGFSIASNKRKNLIDNEHSTAESENKFRTEIESKLQYLDVANLFIARSLKTDEVFRLVATRIREILPFETCALFLESGREDKLAVAYVCDQSGSLLTDDIKTEFNSEQAIRIFQTGKSAIQDLPEKHSAERLSAAFPLRREDKSIYGVIELISVKGKNTIEEQRMVLNQLASRLSPLILKSLAFERNLENSLTDGLTKLPNERAFYLILENQIAESQRFRQNRPLTVLNIDIKNFDEINRTYGHAAGDRALTMAAQIIKSQLRQMDFLSRFRADEFLAILPTASDEIAQVIIERIASAFRQHPLSLETQRLIHIELNFGAASFIKDGETADELLSSATIKKQAAKSPAPHQVLIFPRQLAN